MLNGDLQCWRVSTFVSKVRDVQGMRYQRYAMRRGKTSKS